MSQDLIAFVRTQLDSDERVAREATFGPWEWGPRPGKLSWALSGPDTPFGGVVLAVNDAGCPSRHDADHIACWSPTRALAEIDAKRRILDRWAELRADVLDALNRNEPDEAPQDTEFAYEQVVRVLALPYSDRPGYREEWRP